MIGETCFVTKLLLATRASRRRICLSWAFLLFINRHFGFVYGNDNCAATLFSQFGRTPMVSAVAAKPFVELVQARLHGRDSLDRIGGKIPVGKWRHALRVIHCRDALFLDETKLM